jgi:hypothetical protein
MRQPTSESSHRSPHEGLEARVGVWGDAAGTAPAVTSVRASAFDLSLYFQEFFNAATIARPTGARFIFGSPRSLSKLNIPIHFPKPATLSKNSYVIQKTVHPRVIPLRRLIDFA